jgi:hypothetical protein
VDDSLQQIVRRGDYRHREPEDVLDITTVIRCDIAQILASLATLDAWAEGRAEGEDGRVRPGFNRWDDPLVESQVQTLRQSGHTVREIAEVVGCSRGTAHRIIRKLETS